MTFHTSRKRGQSQRGRAGSLDASTPAVSDQAGQQAPEHIQRLRPDDLVLTVDDERGHALQQPGGSLRWRTAASRASYVPALQSGAHALGVESAVRRKSRYHAPIPDVPPLDEVRLEQRLVKRLEATFVARVLCRGDGGMGVGEQPESSPTSRPNSAPRLRKDSCISPRSHVGYRSARSTPDGGVSGWSS